MQFEEHLMSIDSYNQPKVAKDKDAIFLLLIRLLLLKPGTLRNAPEAGIDLVANYRYSQIDNLQTLKVNIEKQITTYLPDLLGVEIDLSLDNYTKELILKVSVNNVLYVFKTDTANNTVKLVDL